MKTLRKFKLGNKLFNKGVEFPEKEYSAHKVKTLIGLGWLEGTIEKETKDTPKKMKVK